MARGPNAWWSFLVACGVAACGAARASEPAASPPSAIPIAAPETYSASAAPLETTEKLSSSGEGLEDICKINPAACPTLDMAKEAGRKFEDKLYAVQESGMVDDGEILLTGPLAGAPAVRSLKAGGPFAAPAPPPPPPPPPAAIPVSPIAAARPELFDIEAKVRIEVTDIEKSRKQLAELTRSAGGQVMNEAVEDNAGNRGASLSLRIPSDRVHAFLARLGEVGNVRSSALETREVSRKIADAEVLRRNLEQTLHRYEELLAKAANVAETIQVEAQLMRIRTALDRVRGDLEWAKDRVARSTVYVTLALEPEHAPLDPAAKLHPGLRAVLLYDVPPGDATVPSETYAGGGLSIAWPRAFSMDLDFLSSLDENRSGAIDFYVFTLGTELYSDFLGGGTRTFLNPYLGFRTGFARAPGQSFVPLGGTLGLDLYKSSAVIVAVEARAYALIARKEGADFALEPALTVNVAY